MAIMGLITCHIEMTMTTMGHVASAPKDVQAHLGYAEADLCIVSMFDRC